MILRIFVSFPGVEYAPESNKTKTKQGKEDSMPLDRKHLVSALANTGARWKATPEGVIKEHSLGDSPGAEENSLQVREMLARANHQHFMAMAAVAAPTAYPYTDHQQPCKPCPDWATRLTKIKAWHTITATSSMKDWIANHGPLATCFTVYQGFDAYHTGVYHHVSGALRGGHCVCCVGYSDKLQAWICKNSWGTGWGQGGFFLIAYGQCGIDSTMWALELA
jgi:Papain family cysteine protease